MLLSAISESTVTCKHPFSAYLPSLTLSHNSVVSQSSLEPRSPKLFVNRTRLICTSLLPYSSSFSI